MGRRRAREIGRPVDELEPCRVVELSIIVSDGPRDE